MSLEREKLAANIRAARGFNDISQEELANAIGSSPTSVGNWEAAKNTPSLENVVDMADLFELPIDKLVRGHVQG